MQWADTAGSRILPDTIRLATGVASSRITGAPIAGVKGPFPVLPFQVSDTTDARWRDLIRAEWYEISSDSVTLGFGTQDADWGGALIVRGDSIGGAFEFSGFNQHGSYPSGAAGVRIQCPVWPRGSAA
jgi:hypothetical protein